MVNPKNKKTIGLSVRDNYPLSGAEMRDVLIDFFQYVVDNAGSTILKYPKLDTVREALNFG